MAQEPDYTKTIALLLFLLLIRTGLGAYLVACMSSGIRACMRWLTKLFQEKPRYESINRLLPRAERVLNDYGAFLAAGGASATPLYIVDAQALPWPKKVIKQALFITLDSTSDAMVHDLMVTGLIVLTNYQEGVGPTPVGFDFSKYGHLTDAHELANYMLTAETVAEPWKRRVEAERAEIDAALTLRGIARNPPRG